MRIELGYPCRQAERDMLIGRPRYGFLKELSVFVSPTKLAELQSAAEQVYVSATLLNYLQDIIDFTHQSEHYSCGLSLKSERYNTLSPEQ